MKKFSNFVLLLILAFAMAASYTDVEAAQASSTNPTSARPRTGLTVATRGEPSGLRFESSILTFCDRRGGRQVDLTTGRDVPFNRACQSNEEPNIACTDLNIDIAVQSPSSQPNDTLDLEGRLVPLRGRVHDCAADGKVLAVVTTSAVVVIDTTQGTTKELSRQGGDRVAIGSGWVVWSKGAQLRAAAR